MEIEITGTVYLKNDHNSKYETVTITEDEIKELMEQKARDMYIEDTWDSAEAEDDYTVSTSK